MTPTEQRNEKLGACVVAALRARHFDAVYCKNADEARIGQAFIGYIYITTSGGLPYPVTTYVDTVTGETVAMPTETTVTKIEFPAVEEDVIRIDDAAKEEPVKKEDQIAMEERQKEDKEQRSLAIAAKNKQGCD